MRRLGRSAELERQRVEQERAEKARVAERGTVLDANAAVLDASSHRRRGAGASRECRGGKKAGAEPSAVAR